MTHCNKKLEVQYMDYVTSLTKICESKSKVKYWTSIVNNKGRVFLIGMEPVYDTKTNIGRPNLTNPKYAIYKCNKARVLLIFDALCGLSQTIDEVENIFDKFTVGKIVEDDKYCDNFENVYPSKIKFYLCIRPVIANNLTMLQDIIKMKGPYESFTLCGKLICDNFLKTQTEEISKLQTDTSLLIEKFIVAGDDFNAYRINIEKDLVYSASDDELINKTNDNEFSLKAKLRFKYRELKTEFEKLNVEINRLCLHNMNLKIYVMYILVKDDIDEINNSILIVESVLGTL
jgi:hypothetical protein